METTRVDRWLWAVRVYKTRSAATVACGGGHVAINGVPAKPAAKVRVGDRVVARVGPRERVLEVVQLLDKRVGAPAAAEAVVDLSPCLPSSAAGPQTARRDRGAGRPTKRDRRAIDRLQRP